VIFFKTIAPIDPVAFVVSFCKNAFANPHKRQTRAVQRLTPITLIGKATENGIEEVAAQVLAPHFHSEGVPQRKVSDVHDLVLPFFLASVP
jgi:tRNA acetyltransferase TAN1